MTVDGIPQEWNLVGRVALGERLPPLGADSEASQNLESYLNDNPVWRQIRNKATRSGQNAIVGSFCQRFYSSAHNL